MSMKPRIVRRLGAWVCRTDSFTEGWGVTPHSAYKHWVETILYRLNFPSQRGIVALLPTSKDITK